jgi:hypothetical protein
MSNVFRVDFRKNRVNDKQHRDVTIEMHKEMPWLLTNHSEREPMTKLKSQFGRLDFAKSFDNYPENGTHEFFSKMEIMSIPITHADIHSAMHFQKYMNGYTDVQKELREILKYMIKDELLSILVARIPSSLIGYVINLNRNDIVEAYPRSSTLSSEFWDVFDQMDKKGTPSITRLYNYFNLYKSCRIDPAKSKEEQCLLYNFVLRDERDQ